MKWRIHFHKKITPREITLFLRQLTTLLSAGIPLVQSFEILTHNNKHPTLKNLLQTIKRELNIGKNLATVLNKHPHHFDEFTCHLVQIGELTGKLDSLLNRLAHYKEKSLNLKRKIHQTLIYPVMIILTSIITLLTMLLFVVPRFQEIFQSANVKLPSFTLAVIALSDFLREDYWIFLLILILTLPALIYAQKTIKILPTVLLKTPYKKILLARFALTLATLTSAGIPLLDALKITTSQSRNPHYTKALTKLQININTGRQLHTAMRADSLFPPLMVQMIKVGEESGNFAQMLEKITEFYESDIDCLINNLSNSIEPLIIMILGVLIGGLVIAMYLPIFKLGTVI